jgi:hypothetical protein
MAKTSPPPNDYIQRRIWNFCIHPDELNQSEIYVNPSTGYKDFAALSIGDFSFYVNNLPAPALETDIELFTANLHIRLDVFNISPKTGVSAAQARQAVSTVMKSKKNVVQDLYDAVLTNYEEQP